MARHNTAFLNSFGQMMTGIFGPSVDKHFEGESSAAVTGQPVRQDAGIQPPPQSLSGQPTQHVSHPVLKAKPNALITCAPGSSYTHA
jgi:hypothetical protein